MAIVTSQGGAFPIYTENPYISGFVSWQETYDSATYIQTNKTTVTMTACLHRTNIYSGETYIKGLQITRIAYFGKESVADTSVQSLTIAGSSSNGTATSGGGAFTQVYTASKEITHDSNGAKSITLGFRMYNDIEGVAGDSFTVPETYRTIPLTSIPRYAKFTEHNLSGYDETSVTVKWNTDVVCDLVQYSLNGGSWQDASFPNYTVSGLSANTNYSIKTRIRRQDSQLWTESGDLNFTTYNFPHCTNSPNFVIGNALTLDFYNPLSRSVTVRGYSNVDGRKIFEGTSNGVRITGFHDSASADEQYKSIPNSRSGTYKVMVSYGNVAMTRDSGNTYEVRGTEVPTINAFDYIDNNETTVAITGDNQKIVQNHSLLLVRFHAATANYGAGGISQYHIECNGQKVSGSKEGAYNLGIVDSNRDVDLTLTAVDSRGLSATKTIKVSMLAHSEPTATVTLERLNNYEDETYLTVDGSVASVNGKNTMTIQYRYKLSGGSYGSFVTIGDREKQTLSLDKNNVYVFNIVVVDAFGTKYDKEHALGKGVFPLFIDTVKNSVGINCFPKEENSLEVNELNVFKVASQISKAKKQILLGSEGGLTISVDSVYGTDKIPIVITGTDNASTQPVFTIINYRTDGLFGHISLGLDIEVTRDGKYVHINASQWSFFTVEVPMGSEISLANRAL